MVMVVRVRLVDRWLASRALGAGLGGLPRLVAAGGLSAALVAGVLVASAPVTDAANTDSLRTCVNLATGEFRLQGRGACDPVTEMPHRWAALGGREVSAFSSRTLAQAVVLNTGGDTSGFRRKDWAQLRALNEANAAAGTGGGATGDSASRGSDQGQGATATAGESVIPGVTAGLATCVNDATGAVRISSTGRCRGATETKSRWVALTPPQKPLIESGAPGLGEVTGVREIDGTTKAVTFAPPEDQGSSPITSMTVIAVPGGQSVTFTGGSGGVARFAGLDPRIKYTFLVVAANAAGVGPRIPSQVPADPVPVPDPTPIPVPTQAPTAAPAPTAGSGGGSSGGSSAPVVVPGAPLAPAVVAGSAQVTATVAAGSGGTPVSYLVTAVGTAFACTVTGSSGSCSVTGLTNGTAYTFTATATNTAGTSAASPASASATPLAAQTITLANPSTQNFGTTPTLTATSSSGLTVSLASTTSGICTITGGGTLAFLTSGTCTITANQAGNGSTQAAPQVAVTFTVAAVAPGAPTIGAATAGSSQASVAFTAPGSTGGSAITSYTVTSSPGAFTGSGSSSPVVVTGLTPGTAYTFTVKAENVIGLSTASSATSPSVTPYTVPTEARTVAGTSGNTTAALTWVAPTSTGGSAITGYSVQVSTSSGGSYAAATGCTAAMTSTGLSCTATGLTNGTAYYFKVAAINLAGTGASSAASAAITPTMVYVVGDTGPGGGTVFYVASGTFTSTGSACDTACRYLEAQTADIVGAAALYWCNNNSTLIPGTFGTAIGTGYANTSLMVGGCATGVGNLARASTTTVGGTTFSDWFLTSTQEFQTMRNSGVVGGFTATNYWYSYQQSATHALYAVSSSGATGSVPKSGVSTMGGRAIRAF